MGNAFTHPYSSIQEMKKNDDFFKIEKFGKSIRFKSSKGKVLYVYIDSMLLDTLTNAEMMCIILHEIGHNFFSVTNESSFLDKTYFYRALSITGYILQLICLLFLMKKYMILIRLSLTISQNYLLNI